MLMRLYASSQICVGLCWYVQNWRISILLLIKVTCYVKPIWIITTLSWKHSVCTPIINFAQIRSSVLDMKYEDGQTDFTTYLYRDYNNTALIFTLHSQTETKEWMKARATVSTGRQSSANRYPQYACIQHRVRWPSFHISQRFSYKI
jgi:hypothetical protein